MNSRSFSIVTAFTLFFQFSFGQATSNFSFLKPELEKADIILLGEPSHNLKYYPSKIQLVKYLHEELGYNVLAFESGLFEMHLVNEELKNSSATEVVHKGLFPIWANDPEFSALLVYLDEQTKLGNPLQLAGFDCQPSGNYSVAETIDAFTAKLGSHQIPSKEKALTIIQRELTEIKKYYSITNVLSENDLTELERFEQQLSNIPSLEFCAQVVRNWRLYFMSLKKNPTPPSSQFRASDSNARDSLMAVNFLYVHKSLFPEKKIIGWGATAHFANDLSNLKMKTDEHLSFHPMGGFIKKSLGHKAYILSVTSNSEEPETWENELTIQKTKRAWLGSADLKTKTFGSICLSEQAYGNWSATLDGILFMAAPEDNSTVASSGLRGVVIDSKSNQPVSFASLWIEGTDRGTASNADGEFYIPSVSIPPNARIRISCIGYQTKFFSAKDIIQTNGRLLLLSENSVLDEVIIKASSISPQEYIREAIQSVSKNYLQNPFGMEFYSTITAIDSASSKEFKLESIIDGYYEGYSATASKHFRLTEKREQGKNFLEATQLNGFWPPFEVIASDLITSERKDGIFNENYLDKFDYKISKIDFFEGDSIVQIDYNLPKITSKITGYASSIKRYAGQIIINLKDRAILRHQLFVTGHTRFDFTIQYRKSGATYYPYYIKGLRTYSTKLNKEDKKILQTNEIIVTSITTENPEPFINNMKLWEPANVDYNKNFWDSFAPNNR